MAGYWPSSFLRLLIWAETELGSISSRYVGQGTRAHKTAGNRA